MRLSTDCERSASEAELRLLIEQAPAAIAMVDRDMHYLAASRRYRSSFDVGDIVGRSHYELFPQLPEYWKQVHRRCLAGGAAHCEEDSFVHADGRVQWIRWTIQAWQRDSGEIGGLLAFGEDITERKVSEARERAHLEKLAQQLSEIETLYRTAPIGLAMHDRELRCVRINEKLAEINGVPIEETVGRRMREFLPAELADHEEAIFRRVRDTGEAVLELEVQGQTAAGIESLWLVSYYPLKDREGAIAGVQVVVQDITARSRAEAALKELNAQLEQRVMERTRELQDSEHRISAILDASSDAVITIDASWRVVTFSQSAVRLFGYSADEAIGQNVRMLMPLAERERHDGYLRRYAETRKPRIIGSTRALNACRKDGLVFPIELTVTEIEHLGLFVGCVRDMTSARALEQEVLSIAMLEQRRIGQELHDGTQQELTGLGLLAQNLSEMLGRERATQAAELAERVAAGIAQANAHVRTVAHGLIPMPVEADGLPAALDELAHRTQQRTGLRCRFECCEPVELSSSDPATQLFRLAQEAVGNAVKHSGASTITIRLGHVDGELRLEIGDDGVGIDRLNPPVGGVGLRLMQHRSAVAGGRLSVTPRAGGGTVITCALPAGTGLP